MWDFGRGKTNSFECFLGGSWWSGISEPTQNEYGQDILINYLLDISGREYVEQIQIAHQFRQYMSDLRNRYVYIIDLFSFVGRFGANTEPLNRRLGEITSRMEESSNLYVDGDVEGAIDILESSISDLAELEKSAMKMRESSLLWVYVSEWLAVTATLMISGYALDQLMLRRRLYKTSSITKSNGSRESRIE